jgi:hypothetical protein
VQLFLSELFLKPEQGLLARSARSRQPCGYHNFSHIAPPQTRLHQIMLHYITSVCSGASLICFFLILANTFYVFLVIIYTCIAHSMYIHDHTCMHWYRILIHNQNNQTDTHTHQYIYIYINIHIHIICIHACMHAYMHICIYAYMLHICCIYAYMHICIDRQTDRQTDR